MGRATDRNKLRQDYLKNKAVTFVDTLLAGVLLVPLTIAVICLTIVLFICLFSYSAPLSARLFVSLIVAALTALAGFGVFACLKDLRATRKKARLLPYVPPITADTLPADEILVRGSIEPPVVQSEVLLRAAQVQETSKEELLRIAEG